MVCARQRGCHTNETQAISFSSNSQFCLSHKFAYGKQRSPMKHGQTEINDGLAYVSTTEARNRNRGISHVVLPRPARREAAGEPDVPAIAETRNSGGLIHEYRD